MFERELFKSPYWTEKRRFSRIEALLDLKRRISFRPRYILVNNRKVLVDRGQLVSTEEKLTEAWSWIPGEVSCFLEELEMQGYLSVIRYGDVVHVSMPQSGSEARASPRPCRDATPKAELTDRSADLKNLVDSLAEKMTCRPK